MKIFVYTFTLFSLSCSYSFSQEIEYIYDNAGNRVLRQVYVMRMQNSGNAQKNTTVNNELFEDTLGTYHFSLYPNPTKDVLFISSAEEFLALPNKKIFVYDLTGKLLIEQDVNERISRLDFSNFNSGRYVVKMMSDGKQIKDWKVIRE